MTNVLEDLEFEQNYVSLENLEKLNFSKFRENKVLSPNILLNAAQDGEKHFLKLDSFLNSK